MPKKGSLRARLRKAGIRHYDELIHDQPKEWLIENFSQEGNVVTNGQGNPAIRIRGDAEVSG